MRGSNMDKFKEKLVKTIKLCNAELADRKRGILGESTEEQLENIIIPELEYLLQKINNSQLPKREQRFLNSFANAFTVWGWNMQEPSEIFLLLTELNTEYKKLDISN